MRVDLQEERIYIEPSLWVNAPHHVSELFGVDETEVWGVVYPEERYELGNEVVVVLELEIKDDLLKVLVLDHKTLHN